MVRMGNVWDRTTEVLRGRAGILGSIAAIAIFLPAVINNAVTQLVTPGSGTAALAAMAVAFGVLVANIWGQLAMLAVATHPATTRPDAMRQASQRVLPALGVLLLLGVLFALAFVPVALVIARSGMTLSRGATMMTLPADARGPLGLYTLVLLGVILFIAARLLLLNAVVLNERRAIGALARSWRLTRGMTLRLIGLLLLFIVVVLIPTVAVQSVVGLIFRLVLGEDGIAGATFAASLAGAAVTTGFTVVAAAFTAQLYVAATADEPAAD